MAVLHIAIMHISRALRGGTLAAWLALFAVACSPASGRETDLIDDAGTVDGGEFPDDAGGGDAEPPPDAAPSDGAVPSADCDVDNGGCTTGALTAVCSETAGSITCTCPAGSAGSGVGAHGCVDMDLCQADPVAACGTGATGCESFSDDYECACGDGYTGSDHSHVCVDLDECAGASVCVGAGVGCLNVPGGYKCECPAEDVLSADGHRCLTGRWARAEVLGHGSLGGLSVNGAGEATLVFLDDSGRLQARHFAPTAGWEPAALLTADAAARMPQVAMDEAGNAVAVWLRQGSNPLLGVPWAAFYRSGQGWGSPTPIGDGSLLLWSITAPAPAMHGTSGRAVVVLNALNDGVYTSDFGATNGWSNPARLGDYATNYGGPSFSLTRSGEGVVAWVSSLDYGELLASRYLGGVWGSPELLLAAEQQSALVHPAAVINPNGLSIVAVYNYLRGPLFTTATLGQSFVPLAPMVSTAPQSLHLHLDSAGHALAVWDRFDVNADAETMASTYDGQSWQAPSLVSIGDGGAIEPVLVGNPSGRAVAAWQETGGSTWANRYVPESGWTGAKRLDSGDSRGGPLLGMDDQGYTVAVWVEGLNQHLIVASRF